MQANKIYRIIAIDTIGDELLCGVKKMLEFSMDGFVEIGENLVDMIKYGANEPSVGLYYIQQHAQKAVPNIIDLKNNVSDRSHQMTLQIEDMEDSIAMLGSMKECGFPIADEMIVEVNKTLEMMSKKEPVRGLIHPSNPVPSSNSFFQIRQASLRGPTSWGSGVNVQDDVERTGTYFSNAVKSAKLKAGNLKWPQLDFKELHLTRGMLPSFPDLTLVASAQGTTSIMQDGESDERPGSRNMADEVGDGCMLPDAKLQSYHPASASNDFEEFKADSEARLQEWLKDTGNTYQKDTDAVQDH